MSNWLLYVAGILTGIVSSVACVGFFNYLSEIRGMLEKVTMHMNYGTQNNDELRKLIIHEFEKVHASTASLHKTIIDLKPAEEPIKHDTDIGNRSV